MERFATGAVGRLEQPLNNFLGQWRQPGVNHFTLSERALALHLGLGDLSARPVCHKYVNGCRCEECLERLQAPLPARRAPRQPWELAA